MTLHDDQHHLTDTVGHLVELNKALHSKLDQLLLLVQPGKYWIWLIVVFLCFLTCHFFRRRLSCSPRTIATRACSRCWWFSSCPCCCQYCQAAPAHVGEWQADCWSQGAAYWHLHGKKQWADMAQPLARMAQPGFGLICAQPGVAAGCAPCFHQAQILAGAPGQLQGAA